MSGADKDEVLPGCGPGGRGCESRRSPVADSLQSSEIVRAQGAAPNATGSNLGSEQGSSEGSDDPPRRLLGDEAELFQSFNDRLKRMVRHLVTTSPDIVDDACNYAWMEFIRCQPDRDRNWRAWLVTTAQREAWKLDGKERGHIGFEVPGSDGLTHEPSDPRDVVAIRSELRFALEVFATVPERRREAKALWVTGFKYTEIQELLGLTYTRVNHLMSEANKAIQTERHRAASFGSGGPSESPTAARARIEPAGMAAAGDRSPAWNDQVRRSAIALASSCAGHRRLSAQAR